jgi:hypothetical protein
MAQAKILCKNSLKLIIFELLEFFIELLFDLLIFIGDNGCSKERLKFLDSFLELFILFFVLFFDGLDL